MNSTRATSPSRVWSRLDLVLVSLAMGMAAVVPPVAVMHAVDGPPDAVGGTVPLAIAALAILLVFALRLGRDHLIADALGRRWHRRQVAAFDRLMGASPEAAARTLPVVTTDRLAGEDGGLNVMAACVAGEVMDLAVLPFAVAAIAWIAGPVALVPAAVAIVGGLALLASAASTDRRWQADRLAEERRWMLAAEALGGAHTVKGLGLEAQMQRRFEWLAGDTAEQATAWARVTHRSLALGAVVPIAAVLAVLIAAMVPGLVGPATAGGLFACALLTGIALWPVGAIVRRWPLLRQWHRTHRILAEVEALPTEAGSDERPLRPTLAGRIVVDGVTVRFDDDQLEVLRKASLTVEPGEAVAVTGDSASGKSTLLATILGLVSPAEGRVLIDGRDLATLDPVGLRSQVGLIPQHPVLFRGTILDNLTLFRQGDIVDRATRLAEQIGLAEILAKLPRGLDTPVGEAVVETLPEGVRQQIALVRALADEPPIILFDDPGAALDHLGDARLRTLLAACKGECTMIVVSNRPSLITLCDRQYRLAAGRLHRIDESGRRPDEAPKTDSEPPAAEPPPIEETA